MNRVTHFIFCTIRIKSTSVSSEQVDENDNEDNKSISELMKTIVMLKVL